MPHVSLRLDKIEQFLPCMNIQSCVNRLAVCCYGAVAQPQCFSDALYAYALDKKAHYICLAGCESVFFGQKGADSVSICIDDGLPARCHILVI